jgi:hypothetical protein
MTSRAPHMPPAIHRRSLGDAAQAGPPHGVAQFDARVGGAAPIHSVCGMRGRPLRFNRSAAPIDVQTFFRWGNRTSGKKSPHLFPPLAPAEPRKHGIVGPRGRKNSRLLSPRR